MMLGVPASEQPVEPPLPGEHPARPVDVEAAAAEPTPQDILDLQGAIKCRVDAERDRAKETDDLVKRLVDGSFATVAGRMLAALFHAALVHASVPSDWPRLHLLAHVLYAVLWSAVAAAVPLVDRCGRRDAGGDASAPDAAPSPDAPAEPTGRMVRARTRLASMAQGPRAARHRDLWRICLPMIFSWAWNDAVKVALEKKTISAFMGEDEDAIGEGVRLALALLVAVVVTILGIFMAVLVRLRPCVKQYHKIFDRFNMVVGYSWNRVFRGGWEWAGTPGMMYLIGLRGTTAPPFVIFAVAMLYFVMIRGVVLSLLRRPSKDEQQRVESTFVVSRAGQVVADQALRFVYAWAQLHCLNMFFFNYLQGCKKSAPHECGHGNNFYFAVIISIVSMFLTKELQHVELRSIWGEASFKKLLIGALALNTGDAWTNYCKAAMRDGGLTKVYSYVLCTAFVWVCMSRLHRLLEQVIKAREEHYNITAKKPLVWIQKADPLACGGVLDP